VNPLGEASLPPSFRLLPSVRHTNFVSTIFLWFRKVSDGIGRRSFEGRGVKNGNGAFSTPDPLTFSPLCESREVTFLCNSGR